VIRVIREHRVIGVTRVPKVQTVVHVKLVPQELREIQDILVLRVRPVMRVIPEPQGAKVILVIPVHKGKGIRVTRVLGDIQGIRVPKAFKGPKGYKDIRVRQVHRDRVVPKYMEILEYQVFQWVK
jgi:hypothetical protein